MADEFRGLTLRLGADARPLKSAISSIQRSAGQAQKQLREMSKALKFDGSNTAAMARSIDLLGDKGILAARAMREVERATSQADDRIKQLASSNKSVYSSTQRVKAEYNHVNAELQHVYDSVAKAAKAGEKFKTLEEAVAYVKMLREAMDGTGRNAKTAREEFDKYLAVANKGGKLNKMFGQQKESMDALYGTIEKLKKAHAGLNRQHEDAKAAEGYKAAEMAAISWKSALMEAADEATKMKARMYALGKGGDLIGLNRSIGKTERALEEANKAALDMNAAFSKMPNSVEAAAAKVRSLREQNELANDKVDQLREKLAAIEKQKGFNRQAAEASNIWRAFERASESASKAEADFRQAQARVDGLNTELDELRRNLVSVDGKSDGALDEFNSDAATARSRVARLEDELARAVADMKRLEQESEAAGSALSVATMNREYRMTQNALVTAQAQADEFRRQFSRSPWLSDMAGKIRTMGYGLYSTITPVAAMGMRYAIQSADDVDAAYRSMRKTVNGTEEEFEHLRQAALEFGRTHVTSAEQILQIEAIGGQLGVASTNLEKFSEVVSALDIATNLDTETISENLGQLSNIMKDMDQDLQSGPGSMEAFSDSLVRLGNNSAAQEDKIMNVMMRIASMGTISGMATPDLLALSTAVAAAGQGSEAAGTAVAKTFTQIESAVGEGGKKLEKYGEIAGMSAQEFADAWGSRPTEAFVAFIEGLKRIDEEGGSVSNVLGDLSINGVRQRQTLMNLTNTVDVMNRSLVMSNDAWNGMDDVWGDAGDAAREAERKAEGFSGQLQILKNAAEELGVGLLDGTVPLLKGATVAIQALSGAVTAMPEPLKRAAIMLGVFAAAAGPMLVAGGAMVDGFTKIEEVITSKRSFDLLKTALGGGPAFFLNEKRKQAAITATTDALKKNARQIALADAAQSRHVANLSMESRTFSERRSALVAQRDALERNAAATKNAATASGALKGAIKGLAGTAGILLAVEAIGMLIGAIGDAVGRMQMMDQATNGLVEASRSLSDSAKAAGEAVDAETNPMERSIKNMQRWHEEVEKAAQKNVELAQSIRDGKANADSSTAAVEKYADQIIRLAGNLDGSKEGYNRLNAYIAEFNKATGASVKIVDEQTGAINLSEEAIRGYIETLRKQAQTDYLKGAFEDAAKYEAELRHKAEEAKKDMEGFSSAPMDATEIWAAMFGADVRTVELAKAKSDVDDFENLAESAGKAADNLGNELNDALSDSAGSMEDATGSMALDIEEVTDEMEEAQSRAAEFRDSLGELIGKFPELESNLKDLGVPFDEWGVSALEFMDALDGAGMTIEDFSSGVEAMVKKVSNGFAAIEKAEGASLESYLETMQHNKEYIESWGDNLKAVYDKVNLISDETARDTAWAWVNEMAEAGPEYAAVIEKMASQDEDLIMREAQAWSDARSAGVDAYLDSVGITSEEAKARIREMVESSKASLAELGSDEEKAAYAVRAQILGAAPDELKTALNDANVSVSNFMSLTDDQFKQMAAKAGNDVTALAETVAQELGKENEVKVKVDKEKAVSEVRDATADMQDFATKHPIFQKVYLSYIQGQAPQNAAGGIVAPRNAAGGINGIITRPTLTNVGWVGEAGAEAVLHMRHAGGAIIPLSNRQHVKPFAQAVASEMPSSIDLAEVVRELRALRGGGGISVNVTVDGTGADDPDELGRRIGDAAAYELRMRGISA